MGFMQPQAVHMKMLVVETTAGTEHVPLDLVGAVGDPADLQDYVEGEVLLDSDGAPDTVEEEGWWARFSAPGYLDCTSWVGPYETEKAALDGLAEVYGVCEECFEACWDDQPCEKIAS